MSYPPTTWVEKVTKVGPTNLNKLELGLQAAAAVADAAVAKPSAPSTSQGLVWNGSAWVAAYPPGFEFSYDEVTGNVATAATTEATATTLKTATAVTFDGSTVVEIEFSCPILTVAANAAGNACILVLYEDGVSIGKLGALTTNATTQFEAPVKLSRRRTPASGARTYSIRAYHTNAACTFNFGAGGVGAVMPGYIKIKRA